MLFGKGLTQLRECISILVCGIGRNLSSFIFSGIISTLVLFRKLYLPCCASQTRNSGVFRKVFAIKAYSTIFFAPIQILLDPTGKFRAEVCFVRPILQVFEYYYEFTMLTRHELSNPKIRPQEMHPYVTRIRTTALLYFDVLL